MSDTAAVVVRKPEIAHRFPIWLWPNLLSLDAPIVAVLWQLLLAEAVGLHVGLREPLAFFCAVWMIYIADRVLDSRLPKPVGWEPDRRLFYRQHPHTMTLVAIVSGLVAALLTFSGLALRSLWGGELALATCVFLYFAIRHVPSRVARSVWPRELAVAIIFALGTFFPVAFSPHATREAAACMPLFASLCWVNISVIEVEEWRQNPEERRPGTLARFVARHQRPMLLLVALATLPLYFAEHSLRTVCWAVAISCGGLFTLSVWRLRLSHRLFRVAMDGALCSPFFFLLKHYLL